MTDPNQLVTDNLKKALGELVFDKVQLMTQIDLLIKRNAELEALVPKDTDPEPTPTEPDN